jgi:hypothetical protein
MQPVKPDIIARVRLLPSDQGGRKSPIPPVRFGCPLFIGGNGFDCRLLLDQVATTLVPGGEAEVPIKFLFLDKVRDRLTPGATFDLWEGGMFAHGEILEVLS